MIVTVSNSYVKKECSCRRASLSIGTLSNHNLPIWIIFLFNPIFNVLCPFLYVLLQFVSILNDVQKQSQGLSVDFAPKEFNNSVNSSFFLKHKFL